MFGLVMLLLCVPLQLSLIYLGTENRIQEYVGYINKVISEFSLWSIFKKVLMSNTESETSIPLEQKEKASTDTDMVNSQRPEKVLLRIGFVVLHIQLGCTGVIIGWKIPEEGSEPIYEVLSRHSQVRGYKMEVTQSLLYPLEYTTIFHPELSRYFEYYNGVFQYIPKPWLRNLYPTD